MTSILNNSTKNKKSNSLFLSTILVLCLASFSSIEAQLLWSDASTWGGIKPVAGEDVTIPNGTHILLNEPVPDLGNLVIEGVLEFDRQDLNLTAEQITITGRLEIGTEAQPFTHQAIITLNGTDSEASHNRGIMVMGGELELHGTPPVIPWTKINAHAEPNDMSLTLMESVNWGNTDEIVIGPTDYYIAGNGISISQAINLTNVNGQNLDLAEGINAQHWGLLQYATPTGLSLTNDNPVVPPSTEGDTPTVLDERAPVGNLSRNIVVQAPDDALWNNEGYGVHIMIMRMGADDSNVGEAHLNGVEIRRGGQRGDLGRYPFHWHMLSYEGTQTFADATGQYIRNSVINVSQNRGIVVHGTNGTEVSNNIVYNVRGHGIFTEDASERRNVFDGNLVLHVRNPDPGFALKNHEASVNAGRGSSGFWISNPDNTVINNTAADCQTNGFWLAFTAQTWGLSAGIDLNPSRTLFGVFDNNTAHSNGLEGIMLDWVEVDANGTVSPFQYWSTTVGENIGWPFDELRRFDLTRYKTWKNGSKGIWDRAVWPTNTEVVSADNCGRFFAGSGADGIIERSLVIGTSLNHLMNGTDRPGWTGEVPPAAFATYHSAFDIKENIVINFDAVENTMSGVFATNDYYLRPVEKGQLRNTDNLIINSHPGVKLVADFPHFALAGALWDPHGTWGGTPNKWLVYDTPFYTAGQTPETVSGGAITGGVLVDGPFYGFNDFVVNENNIRWEDFMEINVTRLDDSFNSLGTWTVDEAQNGWLLAHMRHFAAHPDDYYSLEFPNIEEVNDIGITVTNMLTTDEVLVLGLEYSGNYNIEQVYSSSDWNYMTEGHTIAPSYQYKHVFTPVASREDVINSAGETYWHDTANDMVWVKIQGGIDQQFNDEDYPPHADELLYRQFWLRVWGSEAALAVEGLDFSARVFEKEKVKLNWTTRSEIDNDFFTIQRSLDGQNWEVLSKVNALSNTSNSSQNYTFIDEKPLDGLSYYRLKMTDVNGFSQWSKVVEVDWSGKDEGIGVFYPNPNQEDKVYLNYQNGSGTQWQISVFDMAGQLVAQRQKAVLQGNGVLELDLAEIGKGIFVVKIEDGQRSVVRKLVKQ